MGFHIKDNIFIVIAHLYLKEESNFIWVQVFLINSWSPASNFSLLLLKNDSIESIFGYSKIFLTHLFSFWKWAWAHLWHNKCVAIIKNVDFQTLIIIRFLFAIFSDNNFIDSRKKLLESNEYNEVTICHCYTSKS